MDAGFERLLREVDADDWVSKPTVLREPSSKRQVMLVRGLLVELGLTLSKARENKLLRMTRSEVSTEIERLQSQLHEVGPQGGRVVVGNMASNNAVNYFLKLRSKLHTFPDSEELLKINAASKNEIHDLTQEAMRAVQVQNDAHGVPVPQWRYHRGMYSEEVAAHNGVQEKTPFRDKS